MALRRRAAALPLVAAALLALAACTSSGSAGGPSSAAPSTRSTAAPSPTAASPTPSASTSPATTAIAPPTPGNVHRTVASRAVHTLAPTGLRASASFGRGVTVHPVAITAITAKARGPGEVGGPAVEITLRFHNAGGTRADLRTAVVTVTGSHGAPGLTISGPPADPVNGYLAPGASVTGRYVFTLARSQRHPITIVVATTASAPVVQFVGNVG